VSKKKKKYNAQLRKNKIEFKQGENEFLKV
jgi:hypothetical protein